MNINALMSLLIFLLSKLLIKFMFRTSFKITVSLWPDTKIIFVNRDNTGLWCGTFSRKWLCCVLVTAGVTKHGAISFLPKVKNLCYSRLGKSRLINICQCLKVYLYPLDDFPNPAIRFNKCNLIGTKNYSSCIEWHITSELTHIFPNMQKVSRIKKNLTV